MNSIIGPIISQNFWKISVVKIIFSNLDDEKDELHAIVPLVYINFD